jgi:Ca2+-binding RTX toxin-like protein
VLTSFAPPAVGVVITVTATVTDAAGNISALGSDFATLGDATTAVGGVTITEDANNDGIISADELVGDVNVTIDLPGGYEFTIESTHIGATTLTTGGGDDLVNLLTTSGATTIDTSIGEDTISIRSIDAETEVNAGAGNDTINVGSLAPTTVNGIAARLTVHGDDDDDTLNVDDTGDMLANAGILSAAELTGLGMSAGIGYETLEHLNIGLGSGADTVTIESTHTGDTNLWSNGGDDIINVRTIDGATNISGGEGSESFNVGSNAAGVAGDAGNNDGGTVNGINALLTIDGNEPTSGSDVLNVDDTGDDLPNTGYLTATRLTGLDMSEGIVYGTAEHLTIGLGSGGDTFTIESTHSGTTTLNTNAGNDTVHVQTTSGETTINSGDDNDTVNVQTIDEPTTVNAGSGNDTINVGTVAPLAGGTVDAINASLDLIGGTGFDTLTVDDSGDSGLNTGTLWSDRIEGLDMSGDITYITFDVLNLLLGAGPNDLTIESTHAGETNIPFGDGNDTLNVKTTGGSLNLDLQGGNDTVNVGSLAPGIGGTLNGIDDLVTILGGVGFDVVNVDDTGDFGANAGTLDSDLLSGFGMGGGIHYVTIEQLDISLGQGTDDVSVIGTMTGSGGFEPITLLRTGGGGDIVNVDLHTGADGFFALDTEAGDDEVDASGSTLPLVIFGGEDSDTIRGGDGDDVILGDRGRVDYRDATGTLITRLGIGLAERVVIPTGSADASELEVPLWQTDGIARSPSFVTTRDVETGGANDDRMWGQRGDDTMHGGEGDDEIIGGLGADSLTGDAGHDVILGDVGVVTRALEADGGARVNPNGSWHKDVLLTDMASITGSVALNGYVLDQSGRAAVLDALLGADVALLAGQYYGNGAEVLNADGSWDSRVILLKLTESGDDTIDGGDDDDAIYGQRGNDTISGGAGADFIAGGRGNDTLAGDDGDDTIAGDDALIDSAGGAVPNVTHGLLVVHTADSQEATLGIDLGPLGTTIVPQVSIVPGREPNFATEVLPHIFGYSDTLPADNALRTADGGAYVAHASVATDFANHVHMLAGNDTISGGAGNDELIGDDLTVHAQNVRFDEQSMLEAEGITRALLDLSDDYSDLIIDLHGLLSGHWWLDHDGDDDDERYYDRLVIDQTLAFGNDTIDAGAGNDIAIGDNATFVTPQIFVPVAQAHDFRDFVDYIDDAADEIADAVRDTVHLEHHLRDAVTLEQFWWFTRTLIERHVDLIDIGNDIILGGAGNDLLIGDQWVMRSPVVTIVPGGVPAQHQYFQGWWDDDDNWDGFAWHGDWRDSDDFFDRRLHAHDAQLHLPDHDHGDDDDGHPHRLDLVRLGEDRIDGGAGTDLIWGDHLAQVMPRVARAPGISDHDYGHARDDADRALDDLTRVTDEGTYWLGEAHHDDDDDDTGSEDRADVIWGMDGNDILFGQLGGDELDGNAGADWLIGGQGQDQLDGGPGTDNTYSGSNNSEALRNAVSARLINWNDGFGQLGLPFSPFGVDRLTSTSSGSGAFDYLVVEPRR